MTKQRSPQTCSACGEVGHNRRSKSCTKGRAEKKAEMKCGVCKELGHRSSDRECPRYWDRHGPPSAIEAAGKPELQKIRDEILAKRKESAESRKLVELVQGTIEREVERRVAAALKKIIKTIERHEVP